ncbi:MAG TPA: type II secretion system F family protein [Edaphobacter sp.]|jgi:tight adherence protein C|nr:type II secretion system F family protein [Edaphobacter sp.]
MLYIVIAAGLTLFFATTLLIVIFERRSSAEARLLDAVQGIKPIVTTPAFRPATILAEVSSATERVRRVVGITNTTSAARQLALAGYRQPYHVEIFYAVRLLLPAITAILISLFIHSDVIFWFIVGTIFAFYVPDLYVSRLIRQRRERVRLGLPDAIDLLAICMEAGLGLDQALMRVGVELSDTHPDLSDEFNLISLEQRAGTPRIEAWRHMAERTKLEIVSSFVSMLVQTDKFGTPISKALAVFSDSLRTQRRQKAEELAAKTTIKMVFPLVLFIFPSMFIVLLAPAFLSIIRNMQTLF